MKTKFISRLENVMDQANAEKETYMSYSHLWTENQADFLFYFLNFARQLSEEEQLLFEEDEKAVKKCQPTLAQFREQIDYFEGIYQEILKIPKNKTFNKWFKAEIAPFKFQIQTLSKKWSWIFKENLLNHVIDSLQAMEDFIEKRRFFVLLKGTP